MPDIERQIDKKRTALEKSLKPIFGDDTRIAVAMVIGAFRWEFDDGKGSIKEDDHSLAALDRLPRGSTADPSWLLDKHADGACGVIFLDGGTDYLSSRRNFPTRDAADAYAHTFKMKLRGEANRPD